MCSYYPMKEELWFDVGGLNERQVDPCLMGRNLLDNSLHLGMCGNLLNHSSVYSQ